MNRRLFLSALAGAVLDPERLLWVPGRKRIFVPPVPKVVQGGSLIHKGGFVFHKDAFVLTMDRLATRSVRHIDMDKGCCTIDEIWKLKRAQKHEEPRSRSSVAR